MTTLSIPIVQDGQRTRLLGRFKARITLNTRLNRSLVSFQANRNLPFYSWYKYKEGFSAGLVDSLIAETGQSGGQLLDPFAGAGTALFVGSARSFDSTGIEISPVGEFIVSSRLTASRVRPGALRTLLDKIVGIDWEDYFTEGYSFQHIPITEGAFPVKTERAIGGFRAFTQESVKDAGLRRLMTFACFSVLESVSYTRKDGQYLRWDHRARKERTSCRFDKGEIPDFGSAITQKLENIYGDLVNCPRQESLQLDDDGSNPVRGNIAIKRASCLSLLPLLDTSSVDLVFTSPPYCNRYDYTRTYALELAFLGWDAQAVKDLRQAMLSCTVENKAKTALIETEYRNRNSAESFRAIRRAFDKQEALHEILDLLDHLAAEDKLNNNSIPRMVRNYFFEMCVVVFELARILRTGGRIIMVNDNVRYAGEEVPVDLILSDFADQFGLRTENIWVLGRGKGNSSQQMGTHGRSELRKCVYVWRKE